ncbi:RagB/SusD family nutrient uptake outer membrane protein [Hymenobacter sp. APR13]|uniref:RagB/SusD family nutrient uptake outer membrane protein n=1 Tax=Hymenobacter sp. APR13 TaxID=1356852 RepID=UPI0005C67A06|nr:RagB/SusD family nutrient uptake outer membrane protein [Hymenobacter sp. APR13]
MKRFSPRGLSALTLAAMLTLGSTSCMKDLDREPFYGLDTETVYTNPAAQRQVLAKIYGGLVLTGQKTTGDSDTRGDDEGATSYSRLLFKMQELTTDEAAIAWTDGAIQNLNDNTWTSNNNYVLGMYNRIYFQIALANEFIREMSDDKLSGRGITGNDLTNAKLYRNEARFLRALGYYHALDMFGNVPFVTEADAPGKFQPRQISRADLFAYVESELKAIELELLPRAQAEYGRASQAAAQTLLAHLYLNAQVYTGTARNADVITYCNKVIGSGYTLAGRYSDLFGADNDRVANSEIIFPIICDGLRTRSYGGTTFLVHASSGGSLQPAALGVNSGWGGLRARKNLPLAFGLTTPAQATAPADKRAMFFTTRQNLEMASLTTFRDGWAVTKWTNKTSTGADGTDATKEFVDTDIPLFRLADVYLMYAEAVLRGGGGSQATALSYVNQLRRRGYGFPITTANPTSDVASIDLDFILAERMRELYWESHRRTDLIRFGKYTGTAYTWPFKGGPQAGGDVAAFRTLFPIPVADLTANPTLRQNPGY